MNQKYNYVGYVVLAGVFLGVGYWWGNRQSKQEVATALISSDDQSAVLLTVKDVPRITINSLEKELNELGEMDQQVKMMLMLDPVGTKERIFKDQSRMVVIEEWATNNGVRSNADYQNKRAKILQHIDKQLDLEQFLTAHKVEVSDAELLDYYNSHKDQDPRIIAAQAGIKSQAVEFSKKDEANQFATKLKQAGVLQLDQLAKEQKLFVRNLGNINANSYAEKVIKDAVLKVTTFPTVLVVEDKEKAKAWVVVALSQEVAKYNDFEQVKELLKQLLTPKKMGEMLEVKLPEYAKLYAVVENGTYFDDLRASQKDNSATDDKEVGETTDDIESDLAAVGSEK